MARLNGASARVTLPVLGSLGLFIFALAFLRPALTNASAESSPADRSYSALADPRTQRAAFRSQQTNASSPVPTKVLYVFKRDTATADAFKTLLDVPPVHLPPSNPPWLEQEIRTIPTIPISGTLNQACTELQNPLSYARVVTVTYSEAVFGAGIPFTQFAVATFTLPAQSFNTYCVGWTPLPSASLHRCLLVTLQQSGYLDQRSQRNLDLLNRPPSFNPGSVSIPFAIGNPFAFTSTVQLTGTVIGLSGWIPRFLPDPPPDLAPDEFRQLTLQLVPAVLAQAAAMGSVSDETTFGDAVRVDVTLLLNDERHSGFSVEFGPPLQLFLPLVLKNP